MSENDTAEHHEKRRDPRVEIATAVRIRYPSLERLAHEMCRDMSVGGMFVESMAPPPVGTRLEFEIGIPLRQPKTVTGEGIVAWRRRAGDADGRPPGFGVQFVALDPRFRELIYRVVDRFIQKGGMPFDLDG